MMLTNFSLLTRKSLLWKDVPGKRLHAYMLAYFSGRLVPVRCHRPVCVELVATDLPSVHKLQTRYQSEFGWRSRCGCIRWWDSGGENLKSKQDIRGMRSTWKAMYLKYVRFRLRLCINVISWMPIWSILPKKINIYNFYVCHWITIQQISVNWPNGNLVVHVKIVNIYVFLKSTELQFGEIQICQFGWLH